MYNVIFFYKRTYYNNRSFTSLIIDINLGMAIWIV